MAVLAESVAERHVGGHVLEPRPSNLRPDDSNPNPADEDDDINDIGYSQSRRWRPRLDQTRPDQTQPVLTQNKSNENLNILRLCWIVIHSVAPYIYWLK